MLQTKLDQLQQKTDSAFDSIYAANALEKVVCYCGSTIPQSLWNQTPLANFEQEVRNIMDKTGYSYALELIDIVVTCDGGCYEPYYCLCWYDGKIHTKTFHFSTP